MRFCDDTYHLFVHSLLFANLSCFGFLGLLNKCGLPSIFLLTSIKATHLSLHHGSGKFYTSACTYHFSKQSRICSSRDFGLWSDCDAGDRAVTAHQTYLRVFNAFCCSLAEEDAPRRVWRMACGGRMRKPWRARRGSCITPLLVLELRLCPLREAVRVA